MLGFIFVPARLFGKVTPSTDKEADIGIENVYFKGVVNFKLHQEWESCKALNL